MDKLRVIPFACGGPRLSILLILLLAGPSLANAAEQFFTVTSGSMVVSAQDPETGHQTTGTTFTASGVETFPESPGLTGPRFSISGGFGWDDENPLNRWGGFAPLAPFEINVFGSTAGGCPPCFGAGVNVGGVPVSFGSGEAQFTAQFPELPPVTVEHSVFFPNRLPSLVSLRPAATSVRSVSGPRRSRVMSLVVQASSRWK